MWYLVLFFWKGEKTPDDCIAIAIPWPRKESGMEGNRRAPACHPANKKCKKRLETRLPFDMRCVKHAQTFPLLGPSMCRSRQVKPREIVCAAEMVDLIESLIMRATVLFRQLWRMVVPVRARVQRIGKGGRAGDEGSQWPTWSMSGLTERGK